MNFLCSAIAGLCGALVLSACDLSSFFGPADVYQYTYANGPDVSAANPVSCQSIPDTTTWLPWSAHYSDDTDKAAPTVYWYAPTGESGPLPIYTALVSGTPYAGPTTDAINRWYDDLSQRVPSGHYLRLYPQESSDSSALVQIRLENSEPAVGAAETDFGTITGAGTIDGTRSAEVSGGYIAGAMIRIYTPETDGYDATDKWATVAHEIGHAMGLNHNRFPTSIMYPSGNVDWHCFGYGSPLPRQDTAQLINVYDPRLNSDESTQQCGTRTVCPQVVGTGAPRRRAPGTTFTPAITTSMLSAPRYASVRIAVLRRLSWLHGHNHFDFTRLSIDSLWLGSPLVVRGTIGGTLHRFNDGGRFRDVRAIEISSVLHQAGTAVYAPGQSVLFSEPMAFQDVPYADDPPLRNGTSAVFFLVPSRHRSFNHLGRTPLFEQTAPAVSTWVDAPMGPRPVSAMRTRIAAELRGSLSARIASGRRNGTGLGASLSVSGLLRRTEVSRGLRPGQNDGLLLSNPREALRRAYAYDLLHSR